LAAGPFCRPSVALHPLKAGDKLKHLSEWGARRAPCTVHLGLPRARADAGPGWGARGARSGATSVPRCALACGAGRGGRALARRGGRALALARLDPSPPGAAPRRPAARARHAPPAARPAAAARPAGGRGRPRGPGERAAEPGLGAGTAGGRRAARALLLPAGGQPRGPEPHALAPR
jgi:hypothetical protein